MKNWKIISKNRREKLINILNTHDKFKNSFLWNLTYKHHPISNKLNFTYGNNEYSITQTTNPSRRYLYYKLYITVNGKQKDIRVIKKLLNL